MSDQTIARLDRYVALLGRWNGKINLVAQASLSQIWHRHIRDSAQLMDHCPPAAQTWLDLGSGGGLPGVVVALLAAERQPDLHLTLVESDQRKAAFLRTVARETGVGFKVLAQRVEDVPPQASDVVSARALAPLPQLLGYVARHLGETGVALLPKGANHQIELQQALEHWNFTHQKVHSVTQPDAVLLSIRDIKRV